MQLFVRKEASGHDGMQPTYTHTTQNKHSISSIMSTTTTATLVVGATGATGKHVVLQLLQQKHHVRAIARSKQRLLDTLNEISPNDASEEYADFLTVTEAAVLDLSDEELENLCSGCDACVSCLGHNMTFQGVFGKPRRLVTDAVKRMCDAIETNQSKEKDSKIRMVKFILMGSDGVANPNGQDEKRTFGERFLIFLLRYLIPPHRDNENAAAYISGKTDNPNLEWTVIRPTDLIDGSVTKYELLPRPPGSLFGDGVATRSNVAKSMVDMILTQSLWDEWKFKMPVLHDLN
jgi:hypothetical protein